MSGGWGCPHEIDDKCTRINDLPCDPGMKGCVLHGRYRFANEEINERWHKRQTEQLSTGSTPENCTDEKTA